MYLVRIPLRKFPSHVCRSVLVAPGGFFVCEHHIVHVHGMVWHFAGGGKL